MGLLPCAAENMASVDMGTDISRSWFIGNLSPPYE